VNTDCEKKKGIMKKLLLTSIFGLLCACATQQQASAWINSKFGMGMNWSWQSGGNSLGYGLFRDGQPGGADFVHSCVATPAYPRPTCCVAQPAPVMPAPQVYCPPGATAPAAGFNAPPAVPANTNTQSLRYPSYRPMYPAAPSYGYPANYYRGY